MRRRLRLRRYRCDLCGSGSDLLCTGSGGQLLCAGSDLLCPGCPDLCGSGRSGLWSSWRHGSGSRAYAGPAGSGSSSGRARPEAEGLV